LQLWEDVGGMEELTVMVVPDLPTGFIPYVMHNKPFLTKLELGELSNQLIYLICYTLKGTLQSFSFRDGYSQI
jgi:hypothetical protein